MNIIKKTRIQKELSVKNMAMLLNIEDSDYVLAENDYNNVNALLCKKICIILCLDFNKI